MLHFSAWQQLAEFESQLIFPSICNDKCDFAWEKNKFPEEITMFLIRISKWIKQLSLSTVNNYKWNHIVFHRLIGLFKHSFMLKFTVYIFFLYGWRDMYLQSEKYQSIDKPVWIPFRLMKLHLLSDLIVETIKYAICISSSDYDVLVNIMRVPKSVYFRQVMFIFFNWWKTRVQYNGY